MMQLNSVVFIVTAFLLLRSEEASVCLCEGMALFGGNIPNFTGMGDHGVCCLFKWFWEENTHEIICTFD